MKALLVIVSLCALITGLIVAQMPAGSPPTGHIVVNADAIAWQDGPPGLPPGAQMVVLDGDPTKPGMFTMRGQLPAGYKIPAHYHSQPERVTVISGTLNIAMGDKFDSSHGDKVTAGGFTSMPARMTHYAWFDEPTVLQLTGMGPWDIVYVNPADDPRKK